MTGESQPGMQCGAVELRRIFRERGFRHVPRTQSSMPPRRAAAAGSPGRRPAGISHCSVGVPNNMFGSVAGASISPLF